MVKTQKLDMFRIYKIEGGYAYSLVNEGGNAFLSSSKYENLDDEFIESFKEHFDIAR